MDVNMQIDHIQIQLCYIGHVKIQIQPQKYTNIQIGEMICGNGGGACLGCKHADGAHPDTIVLHWPSEDINTTTEIYKYKMKIPKYN